MISQLIRSLIVGLVLFTGCARAQMITEVEDKIIEQASKVRSYKAKLKTETRINNEYFHRSDMDGTYEVMRKGDQVLFRSEGTVTGEYMPPDSAPRQMDRDTLQISDGETTWMYMDSMRERWPLRRAFKHPSQPGVYLLPDRAYFDRIRLDHTLELWPEEEVNGQKAYVIAAIPDEKGRLNRGRTLYYFSKEHGIPIKQVAYDVQDNPFNTSVLADLQVNVPIAPERFKFELPEGVPLEELPPESYAPQKKAAQDEKKEQPAADSSDKGKAQQSAEEKGKTTEPEKKAADAEKKPDKS